LQFSKTLSSANSDLMNVPIPLAGEHLPAPDGILYVNRPAQAVAPARGN